MNLTHALKFAVIQGLLATAAGAGYIAGFFDPVFASDAKWIILGLSVVVLYGLVSAFRKKWNSVTYAAITLVRCGIVALNMALAGALMAMAAGDDNKAFLTLLVTGIISSLYALGSSLYLDGHTHFLGDDDDFSQE